MTNRLGKPLWWALRRDMGSFEFRRAQESNAESSVGDQASSEVWEGREPARGGITPHYRRLLAASCSPRIAFAMHNGVPHRIELLFNLYVLLMPRALSLDCSGDNRLDIRTVQ
jgi:hypothetical protein